MCPCESIINNWFHFIFVKLSTQVFCRKKWSQIYFPIHTTSQPTSHPRNQPPSSPQTSYRNYAEIVQIVNYWCGRWWLAVCGGWVRVMGKLDHIEISLMEHLHVFAEHWWWYQFTSPLRTTIGSFRRTCCELWQKSTTHQDPTSSYQFLSSNNTSNMKRHENWLLMESSAALVSFRVSSENDFPSRFFRNLLKDTKGTTNLIHRCPLLLSTNGVCLRFVKFLWQKMDKTQKLIKKR